MSKEREIQKHLIEKDSTGMIDWDSIIDDLSTNLYIDETKDGDNTINGDRLLFDAEYRKTILTADATGTLPDYLNPRPFINKLGLTYQEARHDEIKMNIKNMDFTNKILEEDEDIDPDQYYVGELELSELFDNLDFGNDGVLGIDDARIALQINAVYSSKAEAIPTGFFKQVFEYTNKYSFTDDEWDQGFNRIVNQNWDGDDRADTLLTYDNYHNRHNTSIAREGTNGYYYLDLHQVSYKNDALDIDAQRLEYSAYFNPAETTALTALAFLQKVNAVYYQADTKIDPVLASKILLIIDEVNFAKSIPSGSLRPAYVTKQEFIDYVKNTKIFPSNQYSKLKSYLNLLMPRYARRVEVEDLNKNFWVLGQVCDAIGEAIWREDGIVDAIQALIKQLNYLSTKVNLINLMFGFDGQTTVKLTGDKFASMCQGYDLTNLYINIQKGNGYREIKVPIYNNLNNYNRELDYTDFDSFCDSWNKVGTYPMGGQNNSTVALNIWDIYQSTEPFRVAGSPSSASEINGKQIIHPFFYNVSVDSTSAASSSTRDGWYLETLDNMLADGADFEFVKDLNMIMYNPNYYAYYRANNSDEFTLTEVIISDKSSTRKVYTYDATKILAMPNNAMAELELVMLNFEPQSVNTDAAYVNGNTGSLPSGFNNYTDYNALNLHLECASRASYRYEPSFVLKDAVYNRKSGVGIQYLCPGLIDKSGEKYREVVYLSNMLIPIESLTAPCTGELKEVSESKATNIVHTSNGCYSYITLSGETGRTGIMTYVTSGSARPQGLVQNRISQALNDTGMCQSSAANGDPTSNFIDQARYIIDGVSSGLKGSRKLLINQSIKNTVIAVPDQTYTWDGQSYTVTGGWYNKAANFIDLIQSSGDQSTERVPDTYMTDLIENDNTVSGLAKIKAFCESIGLIYGNAFAMAQFPNRINPAAAPCVVTSIANYGDAYVSNVRHARQVFIIPICYDYTGDGSTDYEGNIFADLTKTALILFNWGAIAKDVATSTTEVRYFADNIDQCWVDNNEWVFTYPPIGYIIIAATTDMPEGKGDITHSADRDWKYANSDCDFHYPMFYGKKISDSPYLFMWPSEDQSYQNAWKTGNLPTNGLTITRIDNNIS